MLRLLLSATTSEPVFRPRYDSSWRKYYLLDFEGAKFLARKITPFLMFEGNAEAAMRFYVDLFHDSEIKEIIRYGPGESGMIGSVQRADFTIAGQDLICIDSHIQHGFTFTPAMSLFVECENEAEFEMAFAQLSTEGIVLMPPGSYGFSQKFCWVNDRYGVSWQLNLA